VAALLQLLDPPPPPSLTPFPQQQEAENIGMLNPALSPDDRGLKSSKTQNGANGTIGATYEKGVRRPDPRRPPEPKPAGSDLKPSNRLFGLSYDLVNVALSALILAWLAALTVFVLVVTLPNLPAGDVTGLKGTIAQPEAPRPSSPNGSGAVEQRRAPPPYVPPFAAPPLSSTETDVNNPTGDAPTPEGPQTVGAASCDNIEPAAIATARVVQDCETFRTLRNNEQNDPARQAAVTACVSAMGAARPPLEAVRSCPPKFNTCAAPSLQLPRDWGVYAPDLWERIRTRLGCLR
jgi:hypothetical protein